MNSIHSKRNTFTLFDFQGQALLSGNRYPHVFILSRVNVIVVEKYPPTKGRFQKLLSGFFLRYPPIPLSFFEHNVFPLRAGEGTPHNR